VCTFDNYQSTAALQSSCTLPDSGVHCIYHQSRTSSSAKLTRKNKTPEYQTTRVHGRGRRPTITTTSSGCRRPRLRSLVLPRASATTTPTWRDSPSPEDMAAAEVFSPTVAAAAQQQQRGKAAWQAWQAVVGWIGFLLQVLLQILRGTASCAQLLSFVGFRYPLLSAPAASEPSPEVAFVPLRSEIPADTAPAPTPPPEPLDRLTVRKIRF
jgi:hypothetical protein